MPDKSIINVPWKIDDAASLPLAVIADVENGDGICEIGERTPINLAIAARIVYDHNRQINEEVDEFNYMVDPRSSYK